MSISSIAALIAIGTPAAAELPPPEPVALQASSEAAPGAVTAEEAPPAEVQPAEQPPPDGNDIIVSEDRKGPPGDPLLKLNAQSYDVTQAVDDAFVGPVAKGYRDVLPKPVRSGLRNFLRNLKEPIIALNFLLQLKPGKAAETLGRFAINSTVGIAGLIDVADDKGINLPFRPNGFADTMGYYGIKPGPYFFLPLLGPTTLRDFVGFTLDSSFLPVTVAGPFADPKFTIPEIVINSLNSRVEFDDELRAQRESADPYTASRESYLKMRQAEIDALHGRIMMDSNAFPAPVMPEPPASDLPAAPVPAEGLPAAPELLE